MSPEGEYLPELGYHLHPAFLVVVLFENVFLSGGDELQALGRRGGRPFVSIEAVHHVAGDAVFWN